MRLQPRSRTRKEKDRPVSIVNEPNRDPKIMTPAPGKLKRSGWPRLRWLGRWILRLFLAALVCVGLAAWYYEHRHRDAIAGVRAAVPELDHTVAGWRCHEL